MTNRTLSKISQTIIDIHDIAREVEYKDLSNQIRLLADSLAKAGNIYHDYLRKDEDESSRSNTDNR